MKRLGIVIGCACIVLAMAISLVSWQIAGAVVANRPSWLFNCPSHNKHCPTKTPTRTATPCPTITPTRVATKTRTPVPTVQDYTYCFTLPDSQGTPTVYCQRN